MPRAPKKQYRATLKFQTYGDTRVEEERNKGPQAWSTLIRDETKLSENALPAGEI